MTKPEGIRSARERFTENYERIYRREARFGSEPAMTPEEKSGRLVLLSAGLLTLVAIGCGSLGLWRIGTDLDWTGHFFIQEGFLSHWQVWIGAAVVIEYTSWWLTRHAGIMGRREVQLASGD